MILLLNENDFEKYEVDSDKSKISNYYGMKDTICNRPEFDSQDSKDDFSLKTLLNIQEDIELLKPIYKQNKRINKVKCLNDKMCVMLLNNK